MYENGVHRELFGPTRKDVIGARRELLNEQLHNLYYSPHIFRAIKSRIMWWVGHVAHMRVFGQEA
jgi:hypothetical protein